jgi:predicted phage terminase large subunit-like protein
VNKPNPTDQILTPAEYQAVLRQDFVAFIQRCFHELNPQTRFLWNWHIEILAAKLEGVRRGKITRLIINIPPRHLKSLCASIALPAWWLGHDPAAQILCVSYAQDLSDKLSRDCRSIMHTAWYQALFPTRLSAERQSVQEFVTATQGHRLATSIGGVLTGRGADLIIIDDPLKPDEAVSDTRRKGVNEWYDNTLYSRLNDKAHGGIILIMQRLHEDDLVGHVLKQEGWDIVSFPAIAEQDEEYAVDTAFGPFRFIRRLGELLHPERESKETLGLIRQAIGEYNFAGQYQQSPAPLGGGMVKETWFMRYGPNERPERFDQVLQSWDTANKPTELSDYSVCTTWGITDQRLYLLHVFRRRLAYPDLKRAVYEQAQTFKASVVLIEDKASGTQLIQELLEQGMQAVTRYKPEHDKVMRLHAQTATIENGFVYLPREAHWLVDYLQEITSFPNAKYDDQTDSTSQALAWTKQRPAGWGLFEFYRREAERIRNPEPDIMITLQAPPGVSNVYTITGRPICVRPDRTIEVSAEEAKPLLPAGFQRCG